MRTMRNSKRVFGEAEITFSIDSIHGFDVERNLLVKR